MAEDPRRPADLRPPREKDEMIARWHAAQKARTARPGPAPGTRSAAWRKVPRLAPLLETAPAEAGLGQAARLAGGDRRHVGEALLRV
jgi:hypothetical protein